jgi:hypothetical protein
MAKKTATATESNRSTEPVSTSERSASSHQSDAQPEPKDVFAQAKLCKLSTAQSGEITRCVATWMVKTMQPFSSVKEPTFKAMLHALQPKYQVPDSKTVRDHIIPTWYACEWQ